MSTSLSDPHVPRLDTDALIGLGEDVLIIDAHGSAYFASGHIPGAVNLPPHLVASRVATTVGSRSAPLVVYGARGSSNAAIVADQLIRLGYRDVALYEDGLEGWIAAGLPVEATEPTVEQDLPPTAATAVPEAVTPHEIHTER